jgi:hypothetical protein
MKRFWYLLLKRVAVFIGLVKAFMVGSAELFAGESFVQFCSAWKLD